MRASESKPAPRVIQANRRQLELVPSDLESTLAADHPARSVWAFVEAMDLSRFYEGIKAVEGVAGREPTDPKVLVALWLYASTQGVGSAREIDRLSESDDAYRWLRGGVPLNHHMLSDLRVAHPEALDSLLTQSIAALLHAQVVTLYRVAQDGTRVRAHAGNGSYRRKDTLKRLLKEAEEQLEWVRRDAERPDAGKHARSLAAQKRAAEERAARLKAALEVLPQVAAKQEDSKRETRVSTTDHEARIMKMGDGGYRPAYNVQFATDAQGLAVVGVDVIQSPSDAQQIVPMLEQVEARTGVRPAEYLVDKGYLDFASVDAADARGVTLYAPVPRTGRPPKDGRPQRDPYQPTAKDSEAVTHFRLRMASDEAKAIYKHRGQVAELTNADVKGRQGLTQFLVRGLPKVKCVALWSAVSLNLMRMAAAGLV